MFWFLWNLKKNCDKMKVIYMFWFLWNLNAKTSRKMKKKLCFFCVHLGEELWQKENDFCVLSKLDFVNIVDLYLV